MVSKNDGVMNAFIAIAACAILYTYTLTTSLALTVSTTVFSLTLSVEQPQATDGADNFHPVDYPRVSLRHLPTVSLRTV
jgi:hypothetical protein